MTIFNIFKTVPFRNKKQKQMICDLKFDAKVEIHISSSKLPRVFLHCRNAVSKGYCQISFSKQGPMTCFLIYSKNAWFENLTLCRPPLAREHPVFNSAQRQASLLLVGSQSWNDPEQKSYLKTDKELEKKVLHACSRSEFPQLSWSRFLVIEVLPWCICIRAGAFRLEFCDPTWVPLSQTQHFLYFLSIFDVMPCWPSLRHLGCLEIQWIIEKNMELLKIIKNKRTWSQILISSSEHYDHCNDPTWVFSVLFSHRIVIPPVGSPRIFKKLICICNISEQIFNKLKRLLGQSPSKYLRSFYCLWNQNCLGTMGEQEVFG